MKATISCLILFMIACQPKSSDTEIAAEPVKPIEWLQFGSENQGSKIVLISGDEEYRSEEALPQLAKILAEYHGMNCTVLFAQDPLVPGVVNPNYKENIPGLEALEGADLMVLFTRFRALPDQQMSQFEKYLLAGKPLIGIRTATHAFNFKDSTSTWAHWGNYFADETSPWDGGFGRLVLGERWHTHHGHHKHQSTRGLIADESRDHPIVNGIGDGEIWGPTDVYGVRLPLPNDAQHLILGQVINRVNDFNEEDAFFGLRPTDTEVADTNPAADGYNPNEPMMPIAWMKSYQLPDGKPGTAFTTTIGSSTDLANEGVRRLMVNAAFYLLNQEVPEKAKVDLVGNYQPSAYSFHDDDYWVNKNLSVESLN